MFYPSSPHLMIAGQCSGGKDVSGLPRQQLAANSKLSLFLHKPCLNQNLHTSTLPNMNYFLPASSSGEICGGFYFLQGPCTTELDNREDFTVNHRLHPEAEFNHLTKVTESFSGKHNSPGLLQHHIGGRQKARANLACLQQKQASGTFRCFHASFLSAKGILLGQ